MKTKLFVRATVVAMALCAAPARVDDPTPSAPQKPTESKPVERRTFQPKYLLMADNSVMQAYVLKDDAGYLVQTSTIKTRFPTARVQCCGDSLKDLYLYKKAQFPGNDLAERLKLARWCIQWHLNAQAVTELQEYCKLAPENKDAEKLLARLMGREKNPAVVVPHGDGVEAARENAEAVAKDLADAFSQPVLERFTGRIQSVLKNKCYSCHGSNYQGDFKLSFRGESTTAGVTSRNFAAVERQIDLSNPDRSPLLLMAFTPHGGKKTMPLGPRDPKFAELKNWVRAAANSYNEAVGDTGRAVDNGDKTSSAVAAASHRPGVRPAARKQLNAIAESKPKERMKPPVGDRPGFSPVADDAPPTPPKTMPKKPTAPAKPPRDPFDPAEFNDANNTGEAVPTPASQTSGSAGDKLPPAPEKPKAPAAGNSGGSSGSSDVWNRDQVPDSWKSAPKKPTG